MVTIFEAKNNGPEATVLLLDTIGVKITQTTLVKEIEGHPDYPSLLSISDVLNGYGVENVGMKFNPYRFIETPTPFVTQIKGIKSTINFFTVVRDINDDKTLFFDPEKHRWESLPNDSFLERCSGVVLLVEAGDNAGEKDYGKKRKIEKQKRSFEVFIACSIPILVLITGVVAFMQDGMEALLPFVFSILTITGGITGVLLLWYELDQHNPLLQQICSAGKKINCGAILQSKASKIAGVSWSVIGFSYFVAILLLFLFEGLTNPKILMITAWLNLATIPYIVFSVYYQWRIAKQWCMLCLCVQGVLALQLIVVFVGGWHNLLAVSAYSSGYLIESITAFAVPFISTSILLPALKKAKESKRIKNELQKLKHDPKIFETLLKKQKEITEMPDGLGITLGNPSAAHRLVKVCNPYCGPCAKSHEQMEALMHNNPDVTIQIMFLATNNEGDTKAPPVKHLLAIAQNNDEKVLKQALDDWYLAENKDYKVFAAKYPMNGELLKQDAKIDAMRIWCMKAKIEFTPTFFVQRLDDNGNWKLYQMPGIYSVADLKYFFAD